MDRAWIPKQMPKVFLPKLSKEAEVPVFVVHNSEEAEDYFFLFDFEVFVETSNAGFFVRPALRVYAGRDDFSRTLFARQFRSVFAQEFDRMRAELESKTQKRGWLSWQFGANSAVELISGLAANAVLYSALFVGKRVLPNLSMPTVFRQKSDDLKLADQIDRTKSQVEEALSRLHITLHPELYDHAFRFGVRGPRSGLDHEAWPLPQYVRDHMSDGQSGAWW